MRTCGVCEITSDDLAWSVFSGCWACEYIRALKTGSPSQDLIAKLVVAGVHQQDAVKAKTYPRQAIGTWLSEEDRDRLGMRITERVAEYLGDGRLSVDGASRVSGLVLREIDHVHTKAQARALLVRVVGICPAFKGLLMFYEE